MHQPIASKLLRTGTLQALERCVEFDDFVDVISMQAIMNSLPTFPEDFYSASTTFAERCLESFCRVVEEKPRRSALALCRILACQQFEADRRDHHTADPAIILKRFLKSGEEARMSYELVQLRRAVPSAVLSRTS